MNKVSRKNKNCLSKKCSQIGTQIKKSEPNECSLNLNDLEELKSKVKSVNGIVNGTTEDKNIKTEVEIDSSHNLEKQKPNMGINSKSEDIPLVQDLETKLSNFNQSDSKTDEKHQKKTKAKKKCQEVPDATGDLGDDMGLLGFDILEHMRGRSKDILQKSQVGTEEEELSSNLESLEIKEEKEIERVVNPEIKYVGYESELQMGLIMKIIQKDLSEPYSIYTYRYFIHNWPNLCFLAMCENSCVGAIVCKLDMHRKVIKRGYIAMLAVDKRYRNYGIGSTLVRRAIQEMIAGEADEVVLETEITNKPALRLYEALGFVRDKRLFRYYLNGVDALRLKLWLR